MAAYKISNKERAELLAHIRMNVSLVRTDYEKNLERFNRWQARIPTFAAQHNCSGVNELLDDLYDDAELLDKDEKTIAVYTSAIRLLTEAKPFRDLVNLFQRHMPHWTFSKHRRPGRRERHNKYIDKHMYDGMTNMCIDIGD